MDQTASNNTRTAGNVVFLQAKKRGRPKKIENATMSCKVNEVKSTKRSKLQAEGKNDDKKNGNNFSISKMTAEAVGSIKRLSSWTKQTEPEEVENALLKNWVPGYKFCKLYSCYWCQEFSWDTKMCSNCKRMVPAGARLLTVKNYENVDPVVDKARPIFHPPPIPCYKEGVAVFCSSCFYFSLDLEICDNCDATIKEPLNCFHIEFSPETVQGAKTSNSLRVDFKPRKVGTKFIECPHCCLSTISGSKTCVHCKGQIPKVVIITSDGKSGNVLNFTWPVKSELIDGVVSTYPPKYVPVFKENSLTTCLWCLALSFDLMRCSNCLRQLPKNRHLVPLQADSLYGVGFGPAKPNYDPIPIPYLRPGKMSVCQECKNYSKNLRQCEHCGEKQRNYVAINVSFRNTKLTQNEKNEILVPFTPRMVNKVYMVCPQCEFTTDKQKCIHCGLRIPSVVKITILSRESGRKGRNLQGKVILGRFKADSLTREDPLVNSGSITKKERQEMVTELPRNYEPRYREKGVVQCETCFSWSWDFNRCSNCHAEILPSSLAIFPKSSFKHPALDETRPILTSPTPLIRLGIMAFCTGCISFVPKAPRCAECFKDLSAKCETFLVEAQAAADPPHSHSVKFQPRMLTDKSMTFCIHCGFSTSKNSHCTFCSQPVPRLCTVTPLDGLKELPLELNFAQVKDKNTDAKQSSEEESAVEAELIRILDWKEATGFEEKNEAKEFLESIPFGVKQEVVYDHQVSCFPDEIFLLGKKDD
ncbi:uncharacterized protein LOC132201210 [Neocloeon triangulifer]|uniref:uncharacterized protein LOC132201210 n=1 Tax=Neocloeon triangulifer TaxID=2078957 RepID=UPI00286F4A61|nr:uncharacterized protein LOC132201210 [Neocloeon triangulifer]